MTWDVHHSAEGWENPEKNIHKTNMAKIDSMTFSKVENNHLAQYTKLAYVLSHKIGSFGGGREDQYLRVLTVLSGDQNSDLRYHTRHFILLNSNGSDALF